MENVVSYLKGRGAQLNPSSRFEKYIYETNPLALLESDEHQVPTQIIETHPKTILSKNESPDIPFSYSLNPYQGCEHGCIYCYARNTHPYWGYSAGLEFEQKILVKRNAAVLLEEQLKSEKWRTAPVMLSGNTDCYQPIEKKLEITRAILKVFLKYRHPVGLITKNSLILRDLDILEELAKYSLVRVAISVTTLNDQLRQFMEPRTTTSAGRLKAIKILSDHNIPVNVMMAPIIPGLNDHEIFDLLKLTAEAGAINAYHTMVRLNGDVAIIFEDWLQKNYPDRAEKILNKIRSVHGGKLSDSRIKKRMAGEGNIADIISQQFKLAKRKYFPNPVKHVFDTEIHYKHKTPQLSLF